MGAPGTLVRDGILRHLTENQLLVLEDVFDARVLALDLDVFGVVLHVASVEHCVLRRRDVDKRRFHAGQDVLHLAHINVPVDLSHIVGWPAHVVLDQVSPFENSNLCHAGADLDAHEIAADRLAVAFTSFALFEERLVDGAFLTSALAATTSALLLSASVGRLLLLLAIVAMALSIVALLTAAVATASTSTPLLPLAIARLRLSRRRLIPA